MGVTPTLYPFRASLPYRWEMKMCSNFFKVLNTWMELFFQLTFKFFHLSFGVGSKKKNFQNYWLLLLLDQLIVVNAHMLLSL